MKRMLIDAAHPEETRVAVLDGNQLEEFDVESASRKQLKGNIYLAKVTRVEPSLQAAFVDYGGNRHGFLAFNEIHPDYYQIPIADRERLLAEQAEEDEAEEAAEREAEEREEAERLARGESAEQQSDGTDEAEEESPDQADREADDHDEPEGVSAAADAPSNLESGVQGETVAEAPAPKEGIESAQSAEPADEPRLTTMTEAMPAPESVHGPAIEHDAATPTADAAPAEGVDPADAGEHLDDADVPEHSAIIEQVVHAGPAKPLETVGGDDVDEVVQRRRPPQRAMRRYKIQEVIKRRQILLVQVVKEERGNKGAALTTYLSLAGRYCVLMPNTGKGGGISRKIGGGQDRKRLKSIISDLEVPRGMALIVRTAGADRGKAEIKRDYDYLLRLWSDIRTLTLASTAPALIHGEASIINRAIRDLYTRDIEEVIVEGDEAYRVSKDLMKMLIPSHAKKVQQYKDESVPLFARYQIEHQLESMNSPTVQLKSGGYIVMNATEALVAIDVNSGRATRGRNIEETALKTNSEAAAEIARQLRLRDLAGLIVIDFIDMDHTRNQQAVERRLKEAMRRDRARIQIGRISPFGLLELSRQRLRPSLAETVTDVCPHCGGTGILRSTESTALHVLRGIEEEAMKRRATEITVAVASGVALYLLNHKRSHLLELENKFQMRIILEGDDSLIPPKYTIVRSQTLHHDGEEGEERSERPERPERHERPEHRERPERNDQRNEQRADGERGGQRDEGRSDDERRDDSEDGGRRRRRRRRRRGNGEGRPDEVRDNRYAAQPGDAPSDDDDDFDDAPSDDENANSRDNDGSDNLSSRQGDEESQRDVRGDVQGDERRDGNRRRRGRRGGRNRNRNRDDDRSAPEQPFAQSNGPDGDTDRGDDDNRDRAAEGQQPGSSPEGRRRRRVRRRNRGPRLDGGDGFEAAGEVAASAAASEPTLWAASDPDEQPATAATAEPTLIETSPAPIPEPVYVAQEPVARPDPTPAPIAPPPPKVEETVPAGPPRRGWWQRLVE